jgi:hypothetical protein
MIAAAAQRAVRGLLVDDARDESTAARGPPGIGVSRNRHQRPRWGQNFLIAEGVARWIVEWAAIEGRSVLEIGPGRGALTGILLERAAFVRAVEIGAAWPTN